MPRWAKDAKEFTVAVTNADPYIKVNLPKPLYERLGKPDKITFKIEGKRVIVTA